MRQVSHISGFTILTPLLTAMLWLNVNAQTGSQTFNSSGTFTVPAGVTSIQIQAWGGGGGGGGSNTNNRQGGGGGGGAYNILSSYAVSPGTSLTVTVGTGGAGVSAGTGNAGGASSVLNGATTIVSANGGAGGTAATSSSTNGSGGSGGTGGAFSGGNGANGVNDGTSGGGGGSSAGTGANGSNGSGVNGGTAPSGGGNGGNGSNTQTGNTGSAPGGGGGGAMSTSGSSTATGGSGGAGRIIITWTCPSAPSISYTASSYCTTSGVQAVTVTGGTGGVFSSGAGLSLNSSSGAITPSTSTAGTYTVTYSLSSSGCTTVSGTFNVTIIAIPAQPGSISGSTAVCENTTGNTYSISAVSGATSYTWSVPTGWTITSGQGTTSITATAGSGGQNGNVSVTASSSCGTGTARTLAVQADANPTDISPTGTTSICYNTSTGITIPSSQSGVSYQLKRSTDNVSVGSPVTGNGSNITLTTGNLTSTTSFYVAATSATCTRNMTGTVTITVKANITVDVDGEFEDPLYFCAGNTSSGLSFVSNTTGATFSWTSSQQVGFGTSGSGAIPAFTATNTTASAITASVSVTAAFDGCSSPAKAFSIIVNPAPVIGNQDSSVCSGQAWAMPPFTGTGNVIPSNTRYSWSKPDETVYASLSGFTAGSSQTSIAQTVSNSTNQTQQLTYRVKPFAGSCGGDSFSIRLNIVPYPVISSPQSVSACSGTAFSLNLVNNPPTTIIPPGLVYSWTAPVVTGGITGGSAATEQNSVGQTLTNPTNTAQTATYTVTARFGNCSTTFTLVVTVNPSPKMQDQALTICSGSAFSIKPSNAPPNTIVPSGIKYSWSSPVISGVSGSITGWGSEIIGKDSVREVLTNTTTTPQTATYTITASAGACQSSFTAVVTVNPKPTLGASPSGNQTVCSGSAISPVVLSQTSGLIGSTVFGWSRQNTSGIRTDTGIALSGFSPAISAGGTYSLSGTLVNSTTGQLSSAFKIWGTLNGCTTDTLALTVTVNATPTVTSTPVTLAVQPAAAICDSSANTTLTFSSNMTGVTYEWTRSRTLIRGLALSGTGNINAQLLNTSGDILTDTLIVKAVSAAGCRSTYPDSIPFSVYSRLIAPIIVPGVQSVCKVSDPTIISRAENAKGGSYNYTFQWQDSLMKDANPKWAIIARDGYNNLAIEPNFKPSKFSGSAQDTLRFYRCLVTDANGCGTVISNVSVMVMYETGSSSFAPDVALDPKKEVLESPIYCSSDSVRVYSEMNNLTNELTRFNWYANPLYVSPDTNAVPVGTDVGSSGNPYNKTNYNFAFKVFNNPRASYEDSVKKTFITIIPTVYRLDSFVARGSLIKLCSGNAIDVAIKVFPTLKIRSTDNLASAYCNNSSISINLTSNIPSTLATTTYTWTTSVISGSATSTPSSGSGTAPITISSVLQNTGLVPAVVRYNITGTVGTTTCTVDTSIDVTVLPTFTAGSIYPSQFLCPGGDPGTLGTDPLLSGSGAISPTWQWQSSLTGSAGPWSNISGATSESYDPPGPIYQNTWYRRITYSGGGCATVSDSDSLTILTGQVGVWTGLENEDWFYCKNWASGTLPDNSTNVFIRKPNALKNAEIDHTSAYYSGLPARSADISIRRKLRFAATGANGASRLNTWGNLTVEAAGTTDTTGYVDMQSGGQIYLRGNWINNVGTTGFASGVGLLTMEGSSAQSITTTAGASETFYDLWMNNSSAASQGITLNSPVVVNRTLTLQKGIVHTFSNPPSATPNQLGTLTLKKTATNPVQGPPGTQSFVNGRMSKEFDNMGLANEFIFPIGKVLPTVKYRPPGVTPTTVDGTTTFSAEYFPYAHPLPSIMGADPMSIIRPEHWQIDKQVSKTTFARVSLPYINPGSGNWMGFENEFYFDPCDECNVAIVRKVNNITWHFTYEGAVGFSSNYPIEYRYYKDSGYIYSKTNDEFSPFSIGFSYKSLLAVKPMSFTGSLRQGTAELTWEVTDEKPGDQYMLQHSTDGKFFSQLHRTMANGSPAYKYVHTRPLPGPNFYRLLTRQPDGKASFSQTVVLQTSHKPVSVVKGLQANPVSAGAVLEVYSTKRQPAFVQIHDVSGRNRYAASVMLLQGDNQVQIPTASLSPGIYEITISAGDLRRTSVKMIRQ